MPLLSGDLGFSQVGQCDDCYHADRHTAADQQGLVVAEFGIGAQHVDQTDGSHGI